METIFANFFSDVSTICGHEATLQANFMHQLLLDGLPCKSVAREYSIGGKPVDLVLSAERHDGAWGEGDAVIVAFEFKGGAYNVRNALRDEIDPDGYCSDMDKLVALRRRGIECWFVCVDMAELGIALSPAARQRVAAQCARRGIHFAYHAQDQDQCLIARAGSSFVHVALQLARPAAATQARWQDCLPRLTLLLRQASFTEHTATGLVYHALQQAGLGATRISLETYFSCAKGTGRMQKRPDICVFGDRVAGRFNLYRGGDSSRSNDGIKIGDLQSIIEIKGSDGASRVSEKAFAAQIASDIEKLAQWRSLFGASGYLPGGSEFVHPDYVMMVIDNRKIPLGLTSLEDLHRQAGLHAVNFHYMRVAP